MRRIDNVGKLIEILEQLNHDKVIADAMVIYFDDEGHPYLMTTPTLTLERGVFALECCKLTLIQGE